MAADEMEQRMLLRLNKSPVSSIRAYEKDLAKINDKVRAQIAVVHQKLTAATTFNCGLGLTDMKLLK